MGSWYAQTLMSIASSNCIKTGCTFMDITDLAIAANNAAIGDVIYNDDGSVKQTIDSSGVASHPGDASMLAIANRLCYKLGITNTEDEIVAEPYEYLIV